MNLELTKLDIIQRIIALNKESVIKHLDQVLREEKTDWWINLSETEQEEIAQGIKEANHEEGISHKEAMKRFSKWK
ncbi:MAG: hypothetical protein H6604_05665 [Flavobacteriales bacterium]|nr:hypothetical protein [Flavobacteriales bacterium]